MCLLNFVNLFYLSIFIVDTLSFYICRSKYVDLFLSIYFCRPSFHRSLPAWLTFLYVPCWWCWSTRDVDGFSGQKKQKSLSQIFSVRCRGVHLKSHGGPKYFLQYLREGNDLLIQKVSNKEGENFGLSGPNKKLLRAYVVDAWSNQTSFCKSYSKNFDNPPIKYRWFLRGFDYLQN